MIVVLKPNTSQDEVNSFIDHLKNQGFGVHRNNLQKKIPHNLSGSAVRSESKKSKTASYAGITRIRLRDMKGPFLSISAEAAFSAPVFGCCGSGVLYAKGRKKSMAVC